MQPANTAIIRNSVQAIGIQSHHLSFFVGVSGVVVVDADRTTAAPLSAVLEMGAASDSAMPPQSQLAAPAIP